MRFRVTGYTEIKREQPSTINHRPSTVAFEHELDYDNEYDYEHENE